MDSHLPPMAFYGVLALAVAVTARVTEQVREEKLFQRRHWFLWLLHVPALMAWLHVCLYLWSQLIVTMLPRGGFDGVNLMIHALVLGFVGLTFIYTYVSQLVRWRSDSTGFQ